MAPAVRAALAQIFQDLTATGLADVQAWLAGLCATDRFVEDTWAADGGQPSSSSATVASATGSPARRR